MMLQSLTFLGTSSGVPTKHRNVSSCVLALSSGASWMFDCGEGTQHQLQRCERVSAGRIERIFVTHLHGDHCYGLPGLMCSIAMHWRPKGGAAHESDEEHDGESHAFAPFCDRSDYFEIYGPPRTGELLRSMLGCSEAWFPYRYRVTELGRVSEVPALHPCEAPPRFLPSNDLGVVDLGDIGGLSVKAAPLGHRVQCYGYVMTEPDAPGTFDVKAAAALGVPKGPMFAQLKSGNAVTLPTGTSIQPSQVLGPPHAGRKLAVLGDTCDSSAIADVARDATWLVHESTFDDARGALAVPRGHSTARMAGAFAASIKAKNLLLTHFSARFVPRSKDATAMDSLLKEAKEEAPECSVETMEDFVTVEMNRKR